MKEAVATWNAMSAESALQVHEFAMREWVRLHGRMDADLDRLLRRGIALAAKRVAGETITDADVEGAIG